MQIKLNATFYIKHPPPQLCVSQYFGTSQLVQSTFTFKFNMNQVEQKQNYHYAKYNKFSTAFGIMCSENSSSFRKHPPIQREIPMDLSLCACVVTANIFGEL